MPPPHDEAGPQDAATRELRRTVITESPITKLVVDRRGTIALANARAHELFGYVEDQLVGKPIQAVIPTGISEVPLDRCPAVGVASDGSEISVEITSTAIQIASIDGVLLAVVDRRSRRRAERARQALVRAIESNQAELERFVYTISHDLKSPLITIQGFCGALQEAVRTGDHEHLVEDAARIEAAAARMGRLLDGLLDHSRVGRAVRPAERVPLAELAKEVAEHLAGRVQEAGATVTIDPELPVVLGDRVRIEALLQNLLDNALKFSRNETEPRVKIGVRRGDGGPVVFVRDNGLGIDAQHHERIFGLFDKLDPAEEGTGLGLAIARRVVEVHGGRLWVESGSASPGATFCFTLPVGGAEARDDDRSG